jgi:hypothetical protein
MTKPTPGPWAVEPCTHTVWGPAPSDDTRTWGNVICDAKTTDRYYGTRITPEEAGANARLIAAAPDLLAALEALLKYDIGHVGPFAGQRVIEARKAIAKARGNA